MKHKYCKLCLYYDGDIKECCFYGCPIAMVSDCDQKILE